MTEAMRRESARAAELLNAGRPDFKKVDKSVTSLEGFAPPAKADKRAAYLEGFADSVPRRDETRPTDLRWTPDSGREPTEVERAVYWLRYHASRLASGIEMAFPPDGTLDPSALLAHGGIPPGYPGEYPLQFITSPLDDVLECYDIVQRALGYPYEGRHHKFLRGGRCSCPLCSRPNLPEYEEPTR